MLGPIFTHIHQRRRVSLANHHYEIRLTTSLDYSPDDFKTFDALLHLPFEVSFQHAKSLDERLRKLIIKKLEKYKTQRRCNARTTNNARGQDHRHTANKVSDLVSYHTQFKFSFSFSSLKLDGLHDRMGAHFFCAIVRGSVEHSHEPVVLANSVGKSYLQHSSKGSEIGVLLQEFEAFANAGVAAIAKAKAEDKAAKLRKELRERLKNDLSEYS